MPRGPLHVAAFGLHTQVQLIPVLPSLWIKEALGGGVVGRHPPLMLLQQARVAQPAQLRTRAEGIDTVEVAKHRVVDVARLPNEDEGLGLLVGQVQRL
jgi:hypothetical protein